MWKMSVIYPRHTYLFVKRVKGMRKLGRRKFCAQSRALSKESSLNLVQVSGSNLNYVYAILGISLLALAIAYALRAQVLAQGVGTAKMQEIAAAVLGIARTNMLHTDFPGRLCREGNMAFPFSPSDIPVGPVYRFSIYHVLELDDPREIFPISYEEV